LHGKKEKQHEEPTITAKTDNKEITTKKAYTFDEVRIKHKEAYKPWTPELNHELTVMYFEGVKPRDIAKHFGRTGGAIRSRIKKLEL